MGPYGAGCLRLLTIGKIPIFLHWTFPLGGLACAMIFQARGMEILYFCLSFTALLLLHEAGHAAAARFCGLQVLAIEISGWGGMCYAFPPRTFGAALLFCSAGVLAQAVVLAGTVVCVIFFGFPWSSIATALVSIFGIVNGIVLIISLVPIKSRQVAFGSDGYLLRTLILNHIHGRTYAFPDTSKTFEPSTQLLQLKHFTAQGFETGLEILNDNSTTWAFVVSTLTTHLQVSPLEAQQFAVSIHTNGGALIPIPYERAVSVATAITADAQANGFSLICRAVKA